MIPRLALPAAGLGALALIGGATAQSPTPQTPATDLRLAGYAAPYCDAGPWSGAISPEGRPDSFDAGDQGALYVWHDDGGWHLRATDAHPTEHHYAGTLNLTPDARFVDIQPVALERDDRVWVDGDDVLHYDFHTYAAIDGVDFRISCGDPGHEHERLTFSTNFDGQPVADRVLIGHRKAEPGSATFSFVRSV